MPRIKFKTLQKSLFFYYSIFFIGFLILISFLLYSFFANYTKSNVSEQQKQLSTSIVSFLDQEINKMNNLSMNIVYSNLVKEHFKQNLTPITNKNGTEIIHDPSEYNHINTLIDVILAIISSTQTAQQANIYDLNGKMVGAGYFNGQLTVDLESKPWHAETMKRDGWKFLSIMDDQSLPKPLRQHKNKKYLSLTRVYKNGNYVSQGIVEIIQDYDTVFKYLDDLKRGNENLQIYVLDADGSFFYPDVDFNDNWHSGNGYWNLIHQNQLSPGMPHHINSPFDGSKQIMTYASSNEAEWTIIVSQNEKELLSYLRELTKIFLLLAAMAFVLILFISYFVSKRVTLPLSKLQWAIRKTNLVNISKNEMRLIENDWSSIEEIEALNLAFNRMNHKLSESFQEVVAAKSQELDAKFLALQSQMNPHFLYNNLANISVMAEEGMNEQIVTLCENISFMLRYISTPNKKGVPLRSELDYTKRYLDCMKIRYEEHLTCEIDLPDEMHEIIVPMLLVQPLVENSIKYGLNHSPPWQISIKGFYEKDEWRMTISDNGPGFDPQVLHELADFFHNMNNLHQIPDLELDGMGLKNIMIRLKLMYREDAYFVIENHPNGGVSVTIGGTVKAMEGSRFLHEIG